MRAHRWALPHSRHRRCAAGTIGAAVVVAAGIMFPPARSGADEETWPRVRLYLADDRTVERRFGRKIAEEFLAVRVVLSNRDPVSRTPVLLFADSAALIVSLEMQKIEAGSNAHWSVVTPRDIREYDLRAPDGCALQPGRPLIPANHYEVIRKRPGISAEQRVHLLEDTMRTVEELPSGEVRERYLFVPRTPWKSGQWRLRVAVVGLERLWITVMPVREGLAKTVELGER